MSAAELDARFRAALETLPESDALLAAARAAEDGYRHLSADLIRQNGGDEGIVRLYEHPFSFSGGAEANDKALELLCTSMRDAAIATGIEAPGCGARWWPDPAPNAASALGRGGLLVRVNTGLLVQLRLMLHLVCARLDRILEGDESGTEVGNEFRRMLDEPLGGESPPDWWTVRVQHGRAENLRRKAMMAGLTFVLAHELGHHVGKGRIFTRAASDPAARIPGLGYSEPQAVSAFASEMEADRLACRILLASGPRLKIEPMDMVVGAAAVLMIQATLFWLEAVRRNESLAWTHPFPDLRVAGVETRILRPWVLVQPEAASPGIAKKPPASEDLRGKRVVRWLEAMTGVGRFRAAALERGLEGTGLTPLQRAVIAMTYGIQTGESTMSEEVEYSRGTPEGWNERVRALRVRQSGDRNVVSGPCPRCNHQLEIDISDRIGAAFAPGKESRVAIRCGCGRPHRGAPPGETGCGAEGGIHLAGLLP